GGGGGRREWGKTVVHGFALAGANRAPGLAAHAPRRLRRPPRSPSLPRPGRAAPIGVTSRPDLGPGPEARRPSPTGPAFPSSADGSHRHSPPPPPAATAATVRARRDRNRGALQLDEAD